MTATSQQAEREAVAIFKALADSQWMDVDQRYEGIESNLPPPADRSWFRWTFQHTNGSQASLSCEHGERRWRREGLLMVQCFGLLDKGGKTKAQRMAESVRDAYQGIATQSGVWFRNASTMEVGIDGPHYLVNAIANFEYDEVRQSGSAVAILPLPIPPSGSAQVQYNFTTPALEWVINHNLGRRAGVEAYTLGGQMLWAAVSQPSINQTVVTFDSPQAGYAILDL